MKNVYFNKTEQGVTNMPLRSKPRFATGLQSLLKPGNLLNLALILVLILPVNAKAQNATTLISAIDAVTGLKATPNAANPNTTVVTVTGTATNNATLTLSIPSGVTLLWKASLTGSTSADALLKITNGHIEVTTDGKIEQTGSQTALSHTGEANSNSVTISGTGTVLMNANSSNCAIASDNTVVTVKDNAVVSVTSGSAIYTAWADVVINGGTISATSGNAIYMYGANRSVTINGGTISATTGYAVYSLSSAINVNGGTISATTGNALHIHNSQTITISGGRISATTGYAARSSYINISGGVVFAYYSSSTNNEIDDVLWTVSNGLSITGTGVVIGWRNQTTPITYSSGTSTNIFMFPANCAQLDFSGQGIRYTNGSNTGVITIPGVTVNAAVPPAITTSSLPNGTAGVAYNQTLAATGATPITWSIESGSLPAGLSLNGTAGTISGTPTAAGTSTFIVKATNTGGNVTRELSITVSAGAFVPVTGITGVPASATAGVPLTLTGTVNPSNATSQTITWSMQNNGATSATISGNTFNATAAGTATVTATITNGLTQSTPYVQYFNITVATGSIVPVLTVSPSSIDFPATGGQQKFNIMSNVDWQIFNDAPWISITPSSGSGSMDVTVTVLPNNTNFPRGFYISIFGPGETTRTVNVTQAAASASDLTVSPSSMNFPSTGGWDVLEIVSNLNYWKVSSNASWLTISPATEPGVHEGFSNGLLLITAAPNNTGSQRTATLAISITGSTIQTINVTQSSPTPNESIESKSLRVNAANNGLYITGLRPGECLIVFNLAGQSVYQGIAKTEEEHIPLGTVGFYIVVAGERRAKVIVH